MWYHIYLSINASDICVYLCVCLPARPFHSQKLSETFVWLTSDLVSVSLMGAVPSLVFFGMQKILLKKRHMLPYGTPPPPHIPLVQVSHWLGSVALCFAINYHVSPQRHTCHLNFTDLADTRKHKQNLLKLLCRCRVSGRQPQQIIMIC